MAPCPRHPQRRMNISPRHYDRSPSFQKVRPWPRRCCSCTIPVSARPATTPASRSSNSRSKAARRSSSPSAAGAIRWVRLLRRRLDPELWRLARHRRRDGRGIGRRDLGGAARSEASNSACCRPARPAGGARPPNIGAQVQEMLDAFHALPRATKLKARLATLALDGHLAAVVDAIEKTPGCKSAQRSPLAACRRTAMRWHARWWPACSRHRRAGSAAPRSMRPRATNSPASSPPCSAPTHTAMATLTSPFVGLAKSVGTWQIRRKRTSLGDAATTRPRATSCSTRRGEAIRDFHPRRAAKLPDDEVFLFAHSLGGIACFELLVEDRPAGQRQGAHHLWIAGAVLLRDRRAAQPRREGRAAGAPRRGSTSTTCPTRLGYFGEKLFGSRMVRPTRRAANRSRRRTAPTCTAARCGCGSRHGSTGMLESAPQQSRGAGGRHRPLPRVRRRWRLGGVADALRRVDWLMKRGVPAANVALFLSRKSWTEDRRDRLGRADRLARQALRLGQQIAEFINKQLLKVDENATALLVSMRRPRRGGRLRQLQLPLRGRRQRRPALPLGAQTDACCAARSSASSRRAGADHRCLRQYLLRGQARQPSRA